MIGMGNGYALHELPALARCRVAREICGLTTHTRGYVTSKRVDDPGICVVCIIGSIFLFGILCLAINLWLSEREGEKLRTASFA